LEGNVLDPDDESLVFGLGGSHEPHAGGGRKPFQGDAHKFAGGFKGDSGVWFLPI